MVCAKEGRGSWAEESGAEILSRDLPKSSLAGGERERGAGEGSSLDQVDEGEPGDKRQRERSGEQEEVILPAIQIQQAARAGAWPSREGQ